MHTLTFDNLLTNKRQQTNYMNNVLSMGVAYFQVEWPQNFSRFSIISYTAGIDCVCVFWSRGHVTMTCPAPLWVTRISGDDWVIPYSYTLLLRSNQQRLQSGGFCGAQLFINDSTEGLRSSDSCSLFQSDSIHRRFLANARRCQW